MLLFLAETASPSALHHPQLVFKCQRNLRLRSAQLIGLESKEQDSPTSITSSHFIAFPERLSFNDLMPPRSQWNEGAGVQLWRNVFILFFPGGDIYSDDSLKKSIKRKDDTFDLTFLKRQKSKIKLSACCFLSASSPRSSSACEDRQAEDTLFHQHCLELEEPHC